jgi:hypothetical protein
MNAICFPAAIPAELCSVNDELKAIYNSTDTICVWIFESREDRNRFVKETAGMTKAEREAFYLDNFAC